MKHKVKMKKLVCLAVSAIMVMLTFGMAFAETASAATYISYTEPLKYGMYSYDVAYLQQGLTEAGYYYGTIDGYYGIYTYKAVASFQKAYGLYVDGKAGPQTIRTMNTLLYGRDAKKLVHPGWVLHEGFWYYLSEFGEVVTGWLEANGNWYYLNTDYQYASEWTPIDGKWYYFDPSSRKLLTGLLEYNWSWYYLSPFTGAAQTGWVQVGNYYCHFDTHYGNLDEYYLYISATYSDSQTIYEPVWSQYVWHS